MCMVVAVVVVVVMVVVAAVVVNKMHCMHTNSSPAMIEDSR